MEIEEVTFLKSCPERKSREKKKERGEERRLKRSYLSQYIQLFAIILCSMLKRLPVSLALLNKNVSIYLLISSELFYTK